MIRRSSAVLASRRDSGARLAAAPERRWRRLRSHRPAVLWTWEAGAHVALAGGRCARPCWDELCGGDHGYSQITPAQVAETLAQLLAIGPERRLG